MQAQAIAKKPANLLTEQGWGVIGREEELRYKEIIGHLDIRAYHQEHGEAIIDLKTGRALGAAWLQVGGYLELDKGQMKPESQLPPLGGVLHIPTAAHRPRPRWHPGTAGGRAPPASMGAFHPAHPGSA